MSTYLVCSTPVHGHVTPMLAAAADLVARGHRVIVLTGSRFAAGVAAAGAEFRALDGIADFDDRDIDSYLPDRDRYRGLAQAQYDIQRIFVRTIPEQYRAVAEIIRVDRPAAILVDAAFAGVAPLLFSDGPRPPILALGVTPLTQSSRDVAPAGTALRPSSSPLGRIRNRLLNVLAKRVLFRRTQRLATQVLEDLGVARLDAFVMDLSSYFDRFLQLCPAEFEYPRSDLAPNTAFIGAVTPGRASDRPLPDWWDELDGDRPVVLVTQGTIDNHDLGRLVRPTLEALADLDVTVVAALGGGDAATLGELPSNARVADFVPFDLLLPRTSVYVTNAGYGGVQYALTAGVPIVAAGGTEDKPEVAARVAWSGVGIDLRTGTPRPAAVRAAVLRVLEHPTYRDAAEWLAATAAGHDALGRIHEELAAAVAASGSLGR